MRTKVLLLWAALALAGCATPALQPTYFLSVTLPPRPTDAPLPSATATAPATATPEPTATAVPLSDLDIVPLLVWDGDLPAGVGTGQVRHGEDAEPPGQPPMPRAEQVVFMQFEKDAAALGGIRVWLYGTVELARDGFTVAAERFASEDYRPVLDIGDSARGVVPDVSAARVWEAMGFGSHMERLAGRFVFRRCGAVVYFVLPYAQESLTPMLAYARNLDLRLGEAVCP